MAIAESTRRDIFDALTIERVAWAGRLEEPDFLSRLFDLKSLPSRDHRFDNAYWDIWQHRVNNPHDWDDSWVFHDARLNLLHCEDELFLRFLCETLHPVVRSESEEVEKLRQTYNHLLRADGFELTEKAKIGGRPAFAARTLQIQGAVSVAALKQEIGDDATNYLLRQITRMESAVDGDPDLAIGTAKEVIESICKTILTERKIKFDASADVPKLIRATVKALQLVPTDIPNAAKAANTIRILLSNLASIANGLAELRNMFGTGHGKDSSHKSLYSRHARLAVGAASTLAMFLLETSRVADT